MRNNGLGGTPKAASVPRLPGFRDRVSGRTPPCALCNNWRVRMCAECGAAGSDWWRRHDTGAAYLWLRQPRVWLPQRLPEQIAQSDQRASNDARGSLQAGRSRCRR